MKNIIFLITCCIYLSGFSQQPNNVFPISDDVELIKISDNVYIHVSYRVSEKWGRISANGLIYANKNKAFIFDTPWNDDQTKRLISYLEDSLSIKVVGFVPNHWHEDCIGGITCIHERKIKSYANKMTIDIAKENGLPVPQYAFNDSIQLKLGKKKIFCYYPGAAHSLDNIVVWLPAEQLLFAGCILKGFEYKNIGFTGDGDLKEYPNTLKQVQKKFPEAKIVVPGHGSYGGIELIQHNIKLLNKSL